MKKRLLFHEKEKFVLSSGKEIVIEMKLFLMANKSKEEYPEDYQFTWIAFNKNNPQEKVLFDNHHGKPPHYHIDLDFSHYFEWITLSHSISLFRQKVIERFGEFPIK